jgi:hypothetical protein
VKGRTSNTQRSNANGYASGGAVSDKEAAPSEGRMPRRHGGDCAPEGKAAKPSLARVMRRRADGGRISDDSKREAARLRDRAVDEIGAGAVRGAPAAALTGAGLGGYLGHKRSIRPPGPVGKAIWGAMTGIGGTLAGRTAVTHGNRAGGDLDEANRIERGQVEPGREDRKDGGAVGKKNWISGAISKPDSLRKALHVPAGENIPAKKLDKAAHSDNPTLARRANLAKTLKGFK